ncbi:MAG TPA: glycosyltransferase family 1 protein [Acidimicrobiales bacterium]|nr:glycosyltransferase family 1 protein [Acidimicrobiales bacterium]
MLLAIDTDLVGRDGSGNETYLRGILAGLQRLPHSAPELLLIGGDPAAIEEVAGHHARVVPAHTGLVHDVLVGRRMRWLAADASLTHYNAPLGYRGVVATVVHDLSFLRVPETYPVALRKRIAWSVARSVRRSDLVVTSSHFSRDELLAEYPRLRAEDVVVTYSAADQEFRVQRTVQDLEAVRAKFRLPDVFVLAVGNLQPRKNLVRLAEATRTAGLPLVVAGRPTWKSPQRLARFGAPGVRWLGYVTKADLAVLYRLATVFAYPSLYEGFGLPVVEAMASGTAVLTSNTSALREVAGSAAILVDPYSTEAIAEGIQSLVEDPQKRATLRERGRLRAAEFSWDESAAKLNSAIRQRLARRS